VRGSTVKLQAFLKVWYFLINGLTLIAQGLIHAIKLIFSLVNFYLYLPNSRTGISQSMTWLPTSWTAGCSLPDGGSLYVCARRYFVHIASCRV